jgi:RNA polymerase sigma-70 factor (ECF subfamily)
MTGISDTTDEAQIIASILAGNTHLFHDLIRPHERSVYAMALSLLHNEADAEDAAQEAFLKAFRNLEAHGTVTPALLRDWREIPSEALERHEIRQMLQQAIADLPLIYREVFLLRDVEDLSVNQSAEALGISVASVKVRLHRARIMLQKKLVPQLQKVNPKRRWFSWS